jgi:hypothetical protein
LGELKKYTIGEREFVCDELTAAQDQHAAGLLAKFGADGIFALVTDLLGLATEMRGNDGDMQRLLQSLSSVEIDLERHLSALAEHGLLVELVSTVIRPVDGRWTREALPDNMEEVQHLKRREYVEIIRDFFGKNAASLIGWLSFSAKPKADKTSRRVKKKK